MDLPVICSCGATNLVDLEKLDKRPLDSLYTVSGFVCEKCSTWKPFLFSTRQLDESLRKLNSMPPDHPNFKFLFGKAVRRNTEIQLRGEKINGTIGTKNLVVS